MSSTAIKSRNVDIHLDKILVLVFDVKERCLCLIFSFASQVRKLTRQNRLVDDERKTILLRIYRRQAFVVGKYICSCNVQM